MIKGCVLVLAVTALVSPLARGDILEGEFALAEEGLFGPGGPGGWGVFALRASAGSGDGLPQMEFIGADNVEVHFSTFTPPETDEILTFLNNEVDRDKDGFVDSPIVADANPNGYVVFHFRMRWLNQRVSLGHLLASDISLTTFVLDGPDPVLAPMVEFDPGPDDPGVPEPSMIAISLLSLPVLLRRRKRWFGRRAGAAS